MSGPHGISDVVSVYKAISATFTLKLSCYGPLPELITEKFVHTTYPS